MLERAVSAGARAVVVTVDTAVVGSKDDDGPTVWDETPDDFLHANYDGLATSADGLDLEKASDLTPDVIGWLADRTGLPVVVKGVLRGDDAHTAVEAGAAGVWVSNHGGRQLDQSIATRWALPDVSSAVASRAEVYVDGGVRRGVDVLAARGLGAQAVFVGRPALWALTVAGAEGVTRLVRHLGAELVEAMQLAGHPRWDEPASGLLHPVGE
jgi:4-hydroxymandelate oxidase